MSIMIPVYKAAALIRRCLDSNGDFSTYRSLPSATGITAAAAAAGAGRDEEYSLLFLLSTSFQAIPVQDNQIPFLSKSPVC